MFPPEKYSKSPLLVAESVSQELGNIAEDDF
jgi:hypothetical protein